MVLILDDICQCQCRFFLNAPSTIQQKYRHETKLMFIIPVPFVRGCWGWRRRGSGSSRCAVASQAAQSLLQTNNRSNLNKFHNLQKWIREYNWRTKKYVYDLLIANIDRANRYKYYFQYKKPFCSRFFYIGFTLSLWHFATVCTAAENTITVSLHIRYFINDI